jgi:hypothetical protein
MVLQDLIAAIDTLPSEDVERLLEHLQKRQQQIAEEKIHTLRETLAELREGFSEQDLEALTWAMNVEFKTPLNADDL